MFIPKFMNLFPNSVVLLRRSLFSKSYTCHYATSGSKYFIIMFNYFNVIETRTSTFLYYI